ncbi:MAG TPA: exodeoxyribonuclease III [Candidatus Binatia bacterium]|nr:exodeoxyribonuclease III [Candidatus Binatia bacterium]
MRIASWNVNSLRARLPHVLSFLRDRPVDVLGLQELKMEDALYPHAELEALGYRSACSGQKTYNGVALLSRHALDDVVCGLPGFEEQKRVIAASVPAPWPALRPEESRVRVINVYVPNGQAVGSEKYAYKLRWLAALRDFVQAELWRHPLLAVTGDFNVAPEDRDVHDPVMWDGKVLCSAAERDAFRGLLGLGLADSFRLFEQPEASYSWWDYRIGAFRRNLGLRIDHVLLSPLLAAKCTAAQIDTGPRRLERPSDHAPVVATFHTGSAAA